ncbi:MAG: SufD family Fe-S cluster assembly protein [Patescibacteria group bacterium]
MSISEQASRSVLANDVVRELITAPTDKTTSITVAANAHYYVSILLIGSGVQTLAITLAGENASATIAALLLSKNDEQAELVVTVMHQAPNTVSRLTVHSVANNNSSIAVNGLATITEAGSGSDADIQFRSLLLSPSARVKVKPEFTLAVDDVACKHGAATGPLDQAAITYCATRGIDALAATRLMLSGFATLCYSAAPADKLVAMKRRVNEWVTQNYVHTT